MPSLTRRTMLSILCALVAGAALRLWFIHAFPQIQGDTLLYGDIARNWLTHGIYGRSIPHAGGPPAIVQDVADLELPGPGALRIIAPEPLVLFEEGANSRGKVRTQS